VRLDGGARPRGAGADLDALGLWEHLRDVQAADVWPGREPERLLILVRACRALGDEPGARAAWEQALLACRGEADDRALFDGLPRMAAENPAPAWDEERAALLTRIVQRYPDQGWALRALLEYERTAHDSPRVEELEAQLAALDPNDAAAAARDALARLLLGSRMDQASATLARLERQAPDDAVVATAEAYDLYRQGRFGEALAALGGLSPAELQAPERAVYLGALLAVAGPMDRAGERLRAARAWPELSDEEGALAGRAQEILSYRGAMAGLLDGTVAPARSADTFACLGQETTNPGIFLVGQSVARARTGAAAAAARLLGSVDVSALDPAGLSIYLGGVLEQAGAHERAVPYLTLASDLPFQSQAEKGRAAVETWWAIANATPAAPENRVGLFAAYRGLDAHETDAAFWRRDGPRQVELVRTALLQGLAPELALERLQGLARHVPSTPAMESLFGYALLLQGQPLAARERIELLAPVERAVPEPSLYYGVILAACGEKTAAAASLRRALAANLSPEERLLGLRTEKAL
jgi:tetratricopeptide (TPR) repeat protein